MISGVILAHNEERHIVDCISALKPHVSEIILVDAESTDRTVELARPLVERILSHPNVPKFDALRNIAIPQAAFDWMWFVDADERIPQRTGQLIRSLVEDRGHEFEAITIPFKSYFCGQWMQRCGWWPGYTMPRVLKRGHFRFAERLHGGVDVDGRIWQVPPDPELGIDHYSYRSIEHYVEKLNRYTTVEAGQLAEADGDWQWQFGVANMVRDLWLYYERNEGGVDGKRGWILSWLSGQYRWLTHAKLIDLKANDGRSVENVPADLDEVIEVMEQELAVLRAAAPRLPLGVVWRSPIWDPSGYADEGRTFVKALAQGPRPLTLEDIRWSDKICSLPPGEAALFQSLARSRRPRYSVPIADCIPISYQPDPRSSLNILRTTFESDRIPGYWHEFLARADEIWVISEFNLRSFRRSGVPPEKMRVVPSCVDVDLFAPDGPRTPFPAPLRNRFPFLSIFDWGLRKGWDVLLASYCQEFNVDEQAGLLLKISRSHGHSMELVLKQAEALLQFLGQSLASRPDIVITDELLDARQLAGLYRSAGAYVLPTRGEGWGRPYMEAMASGLLAIGTRASGNVDFMDDSNSLLISAKEADVTAEAAAEIPVYAGHRWFEPDAAELRHALRMAYSDPQLRHRLGAKARGDICERFSLDAGRKNIEAALAHAEERFRTISPTDVSPSNIRVVIEGEFFAGHSFAHVNEHLALQLKDVPNLALSLSPVVNSPRVQEQPARRQQLAGYIDRSLDSGPHVTIRHCYPPSWTPPSTGRWIHIQPWEYGSLPVEWVPPLRDRVDEIWAPSNYVKTVYLKSGVPSEKIHVIPWGVDAQTFCSEAPSLILPTAKTFAFLFVGGAIHRKGIDVLLEAFLAEFGPQDDVCLVVKDMGRHSYYRDSPFREQLLAAAGDPSRPQIIYFDQYMTEGQLASLYTACHCLVAPYRGEGFGLPILESMACGTPAIVPHGGPSDDFVTDEVGLFVRSTVCVAPADPRTPLCGPATVIDIDVRDLRRTMREAFENRRGLRELGRAAALSVRERFTWNHTVRRMTERLHALTSGDRQGHNHAQETPSPPAPSTSTTLCAVVIADGDDASLITTLARSAPFFDELITLVGPAMPRSAAIAGEYGSRVLTVNEHPIAESVIMQTVAHEMTSEWFIVLPSGMSASGNAISEVKHTAARLPPQTLATELVRSGPTSSRAMTSDGIPLRAFRNPLVPSRFDKIATESVDDPIAPVGNASSRPETHSASSPHELLMHEPWLVPWVPRHGSVFVDVGANAGNWTKWLAPGFAAVHSIEPNPEALVELRQDLPDNVVVHECGAWNRRTKVKFSQFARSVHLTAYFKDEGIYTGAKHGEITLPCLPIDLMQIPGPVTFLKCDVEGAELQCLRGARRLIERDSPWLLIECHSSENFRALAQLLAKWDYGFTVIRHPQYEPFSDLWHSHCWLSCQPQRTAKKAKAEKVAAAVAAPEPTSKPTLKRRRADLPRSNGTDSPHGTSRSRPERPTKKKL